MLMQYKILILLQEQKIAAPAMNYFFKLNIGF
jgi:hypothetical protein